MTEAALALKENTAASAAVNKAASKNLVRARVIEIRKGAGTVREQVEKQLAGSKDAPGESNAIPEDPLVSLAAEGKLIEPPFDMLTLAMLKEQNTEMGPLIEAMEVNIESFGHRFLPRVTDVDDEKLEEEIKKEKIELTNFFAYASMDMTFKEMRRRRRQDIEATGNSYWEIIRSVNGKIQGFGHIPSYQMRISALDRDAVLVDQPILELQLDGSIKINTIKRWRRFRLFAQSRVSYRRGQSHSAAINVRWFKELGDPREYDMNTGDELTGEELEKGKKDKTLANEMEHFKLYSPRSPYGIPRYVGVLLAIFGMRAAEEINYSTFRNNNIPSMVVTVSNGQLTDGTIGRIEDFIESQINQSSNWSKFLILEAESLIEGEDGRQIKVDVKPLTKEQHTDSLFQEYDANGANKVRRAWRMPPIFIGASDDYNRATAETSRRVADEQVFAPERDSFDEWMNLKMFPYMDIVFHRYKTNSPNTTDNQELVKILSGAEKTGGMTPRIARAMLEDILGQELPPFPDDFDKDVPFSLTMAEAVKNLADPTEPGQQVTALKSALIAGGIGAIDLLMLTNAEIEKRWAAGGAELEHEAHEDVGQG